MFWWCRVTVWFHSLYWVKILVQKTSIVFRIVNASEPLLHSTTLLHPIHSNFLLLHLIKIEGPIPNNNSKESTDRFQIKAHKIADRSDRKNTLLYRLRSAFEKISLNFPLKPSVSRSLFQQEISASLWMPRTRPLAGTVYGRLGAAMAVSATLAATAGVCFPYGTGCLARVDASRDRVAVRGLRLLVWFPNSSSDEREVDSCKKLNIKRLLVSTRSDVLTYLRYKYFSSSKQSGLAHSYLFSKSARIRWHRFYS